jgi:hypothetical protein
LMNFEHGEAGFAGPIRGGDEALHFVFELRLPSFPALYGEWRPKFEVNGNDFGVEIVSFGYVYRANVANPHPGARRRFSVEQQSIIQRLITALFSSAEAREGIAPFSSKKATFLGGVRFSPGWIILNGRLSWLLHRSQP